MNKLIKLSDIHYIIVDDSGYGEGDFVLLPLTKEIMKCSNGTIFIEGTLKITHSTIGYLYQDNIKSLNVSDIEELVYGYSVDKAIRECDYFFQDPEMFDKYENKDDIKLFKHGFKAHQELTKDKLFTIDDMEQAYINGSNHQIVLCDRNKEKLDYLNSLLPKKEWDIEIDENNKITLI